MSVFSTFYFTIRLSDFTGIPGMDQKHILNDPERGSLAWNGHQT